MRHLTSENITKQRVARWLESAESTTQKPTWTEKRQAIVFGGHTFILGKGQVFQCSHCGKYDPEWTATEVIAWFEETMGIKPIEIEVTVSVGD